MNPVFSNLRQLVAGCALLAFSTSGWSQPISIAIYDINDAVLSGHGNWLHSYSGTITPGTSFTHLGSNPGTLATYQGGSGTLNDGVIGGSVSNSQLFITPAASDTTPINPTLFLTLDTSQPWLVNKIEIYGGDIGGNSIPGALTALDIGVIGPNPGPPSATFATTAFGPTLNPPAFWLTTRSTSAPAPWQIPRPGHWC